MTRREIIRDLYDLRDRAEKCYGDHSATAAALRRALSEAEREKAIFDEEERTAWSGEASDQEEYRAADFGRWMREARGLNSERGR